MPCIQLWSRTRKKYQGEKGDGGDTRGRRTCERRRDGGDSSKKSRRSWERFEDATRGVERGCLERNDRLYISVLYEGLFWCIFGKRFSVLPVCKI